MIGIVHGVGHGRRFVATDDPAAADKNLKLVDLVKMRDEFLLRAHLQQKRLRIIDHYTAGSAAHIARTPVGRIRTEF